MVHNPHKVRELEHEIELLEPDDRLELLRRVITPELELRLLVEDLQQNVRVANPRALARDIRLAVREVRAKRRLAPTTYTS